MSERDRLIARIESAEKRIQEAAIQHRALDRLPPDITIQQLRALGVLSILGAQSSHELAAALGVGATTLTGIVDRLEAKGYVHRWLDPKDRRVRRVDLTEAGATLLRGLEEMKQEHHHRVLGRLSRTDLQKLAEGMEALREAIRAEVEPER